MEGQDKLATPEVVHGLNESGQRLPGAACWLQSFQMIKSPSKLSCLMTRPVPQVEEMGGKVASLEAALAESREKALAESREKAGGPGDKYKALAR
jgi:hypothetical protein